MSKISEIIENSGDREITASLSLKLSIPKADDRYRVMNLQGGGSDGEYGYFAMTEHGRQPGMLTKIVKVDLATWQTVGEGNFLPLDHANDICYDSKNHRLVVSHCQIEREAVSFVDPDTLTVTGKTYIRAGGQYAIAYSPERERYAVGKSMCFDVNVLDDDFNLVSTVLGEDGHTQQGMECDGDYIYCLQSSIRHNYIWCYTWDGEFVKKILLPPVGEAEHLFSHGDKLIIGFNHGKTKMGDIYEVTLGMGE